jgi:hypothetical protein
MNQAEAGAPPLSSRQSAVRGYWPPVPAQGSMSPAEQPEATKPRQVVLSMANGWSHPTGKTSSEVVPSIWQPTNCARVHHPTSRRGIRMSPKRSRGRLTAVPDHLAAVDRRFGA